MKFFAKIEKEASCVSPDASFLISFAFCRVLAPCVVKCVLAGKQEL